MGNPAVATRLAKARGNPGKKTFSADEANPQQTFDVKELEPPAGLSTRAKKVWRDMVQGLHACGLYTLADKKTLMMYCEAFAEFEVENRKLIKEGSIMDRPDCPGFPMINPRVKIVNDAFNKALKLIAPLGLSPSARSGLIVKKPDGAKKSKLDGFK